MDELSDEDIYQKIDSLPHLVFKALYDRHASGLFRFIYRFTLDRAIAEEKLHDIFVQLLDRRYALQGPGSLKGWLYTLARNSSLNHLKNEPRRVPLEAALDRAGGPTPEEELMQKQLGFDMHRIEQRLPPDLGETWGLRKQGLNYSEISLRLGLPVGTVKSRFHRLVEFFRKELEDGKEKVTSSR